MKITLGFVIVLGVLLVPLSCDALRCNQDESSSAKNVKRILQMCIRKLGLEIDENHSDGSDSDEKKQNSDNLMVSRLNNQSQKNVRNDSVIRYNNDNANGHAQLSQADNKNQDNRQEVHDRSCVINCYFEEMKMTNEMGFPEKHKVLQEVTKDIRNRELKDFYVDAIQECFQILELEQNIEKCEYSKNLVTCLTETARVNCEDFQPQSSLF